MTQTINANLFRLNMRHFFFNSDVIIFDNLDQLYLLNRNIFFFIKKYKKFNFFFLNYKLQRCHNNKFKIFFFGFNIKKWKFIKKKFKNDIFLKKKKELYLYKSFLYRYRKRLIKKLKYKIFKKKYIYFMPRSNFDIYYISRNIFRLLNDISKSFKNKLIFTSSIVMNYLIKKNIKVKSILSKINLLVKKLLVKGIKIFSIVFFAAISAFDLNPHHHFRYKLLNKPIISIKVIQRKLLRLMILLYYIKVKKKFTVKKRYDIRSLHKFMLEFHNIKNKLKWLFFLQKFKNKYFNFFSLNYIRLSHLLNIDIYKFLINYKIFSFFINFFFLNLKFHLKKKKLKFIKLAFFLRGNKSKKFINLNLNFKILYKLLKKKYVKKLFKKKYVKKLFKKNK